MFLEDVKQSSNGERNEKIVYFFFVVVDIVIDDAGTYVCVAVNKHGRDEVSAQIRITGLGKLKNSQIHRFFFQITFHRHRRLSWDCLILQCHVKTITFSRGDLTGLYNFCRTKNTMYTDLH